MSFEQVVAFREESDALYELLSGLSNRDFEQATQFKGWAIEDVVRHLHVWNYAADRSAHGPKDFDEFLAAFSSFAEDGGLPAFERKWLGGGPRGRALLETWHDFYLGMCERFAADDPKARVRWVGPDMSIRSSVTARLMETWAHGQEIYDQLGVERVDTDRIKNIAFLGVSTFGWTFRNRGLEVPDQVPYVRLVAPSGAIWEFGEPRDDERIDGSATEFCQAVTQVRNVADTSLRVTGETARAWMAIAQCFAGPAVDPPAPGARYRITR